MPRHLLLLLASAGGLLAQGNSDMHREFPAFKIAGNLLGGNSGSGGVLINTPQGNILINTDYKQDLPAVKRGIGQLGFKYSDTKILLISHAHGVTTRLRKWLGAKRARS